MRFYCLLFVGFGTLAACRAHPSPEVDGGGGKEGAAARVEAGRQRKPSVETDAATVIALVKSWVSASNAHDATRLGSMYAAEVLFYGHRMSNAAVVATKRDAFRRQPHFAMDLVGEVSAALVDAGVVASTFRKRSGAAESSMREVEARLTLTLERETWRIAEETDVPTERATAATSRSSGESSGDGGRPTCEAVAFAEWSQLPQVRAYRERAAKVELAPDARRGGVGYPPDEQRVAAWGEGVHSPERFSAEVFAEVSVDGVLTTTVFGEEVPVPGAVQERVRRACVSDGGAGTDTR